MSAKMTANGIRTHSRTNQRRTLDRGLFCRNLDPEYVSGWCGHGFESHSQPFLLTYPGLIKAYDVLSSVFTQILEIRHLWSSFNNFAINNSANFIAMTLIIARKTITAVFGTLALQLIEAFQCSVTIQ